MTSQPSAVAATQAAPLVAWDIVEESLSEAEFFWGRWEALLRSHDHDLDALWDRVEDRLAGALDGLLIAGDQGIERYLSAALDGDELTRVSAAAYALGAAATIGREPWQGARALGSEAPFGGSGDIHAPAALARLAEAWRAAEGPRLSALRRGVELVDSPCMVPALRRALAGGPPAATAALLDAGRFRRLDPGADLVSWLGRNRAGQQGLTETLEDFTPAIVGAARYAPHAIARESVQRALQADDAAVRAAAIQTGVFLGMREPWRACRSAVAAQAEGCTSLFILMALLGGTADHAALAAAVAHERLRRDAVWALGFAGRREAADLCIELMRQGLEPKLAGEAFCAITGFDPEAASASATDQDDTEDGGLPGPDEALPLLDPDALAGWWRSARGRFDGQQRYVGGRPASPGALQLILQRGSLRRRPPVALELAIRTGGRYDVATGAFSVQQRRELTGFATVAGARLACDGWLPTS